METSIPKQILKGQALNIVFQGYDYSKDYLSKEKEYNKRIKVAKELYYELLKQDFHDW